MDSSATRVDSESEEFQVFLSQFRYYRNTLIFFSTCYRCLVAVLVLIQLQWEIILGLVSISVSGNYQVTYSCPYTYTCPYFSLPNNWVDIISKINHVQFKDNQSVGLLNWKFVCCYNSEGLIPVILQDLMHSQWSWEHSWRDNVFNSVLS